jgi:hypothetical protein
MPTSASNIYQKFAFIAEDVFSFSIDEYLKSRSNRSLYIYEIVTTERKHLPLSGDPPPELTASMNRSFVDAIAGYASNVSERLSVPAGNADVLLLSTEALAAEGMEFETLLLHEICHLLIDEELKETASSLLDEKAKYHGERLHRRTDQEFERRTRHTREFCDLLSAAAERYAAKRQGLVDRWAVINSAMRYDLRSNARGA